MSEIAVFVLLILLIGALVLLFNLADQNAQLREENQRLRNNLLDACHEFQANVRREHQRLRNWMFSDL